MIFDFIKNFFNGNRKKRYFDGAKKDDANRDFWNSLGDFETVASVDRDILRARARHLSANNAIMDNIDNAIINNCVGTGVKLQSRTSNEKYNSTIEKLFNNWANNPKNCDVTERHTFYDMQRLMLKTRMVDGEVFIYKKITEQGLKLQLIEADALDIYRKDGGLEQDENGKIIRYHFLGKDGKKISLSSDRVINLFIATRPTQLRGVTEYAQAMIDLKNFSAFQRASIQGARARANIAYAVQQDGGGLTPFDVDEDERVQTINGVSVVYLKNGEKITKLDPDSVATDYVQFSENTIRLIATARKVSYELAFKDYSKVNFASSRASLLQDFKMFNHEQKHLENYVLNDIFNDWIMVEYLRGSLQKAGIKVNVLENKEKWIKPKWIFPKRDLVDPLKEITALEKKIKLNITTETDVANSEGEDYEDILRKKAKEIDLKKKYGVPDYTLLKDESLDANDDGKVDFDENMTGAESKLNEDIKGDNK